MGGGFCYCHSYFSFLFLFSFIGNLTVPEVCDTHVTNLQRDFGAAQTKKRAPAAPLLPG
jgi:hypothetical protein